MPMSKKDVPCYGCLPPERNSTCHCTCQKYKDYLVKVAEYKEKVNKSRMEDAPIKNYTIESKQKAYRSHRNHSR